MDKRKDAKKLTLIPIILMMFTSVFGFANISKSYYLMGYGAIPWFIISAIAYCIPLAFMIAEYGAAFKDEKGGLYSWMEKSVGIKYAFVGTFMWYASFLIWMVNTTITIWIPLSTMIFGEDITGRLNVFGLNSNQVLGVLAIALVMLVTFVASKGLDKIKKIASVGGTAVALLNIILIFGAAAVLIGHGGALTQPINSIDAFIKSPNPAYQTSISTLSFMVFAIFAFGGIEIIGGVVDETENPSVVFPKAITIGAIVISIGYTLGIFLCGTYLDWNEVLSSENVNLANVIYISMHNLGIEIGQSLGLSSNFTVLLGSIIARFTGLSMFLAMMGAFFNVTYIPLKQLIEGTPKNMWGGKLSELKDGIPKFAMKLQACVLICIIALVSFGSEGASQFFAKLVLMTNVAMTLPIAFMAGAFPAFKRKKEILKTFEFYKSYKSAKFASYLVTGIVCFANFFTIIEPITRGKYSDSIWMAIGPILFTTVALIIYKRYETREKYKNSDEIVA